MRGESERERERSKHPDGDGRGRGDGDGGGGGGDKNNLNGGEQFVFGSGSGSGLGNQRKPNQEEYGDVRRQVSQSYREKLLAPGGLGFLVSHGEADDIVSGWKGFFARQRGESEAGIGGEDGDASGDDMGDSLNSKYPILSITSYQYTSWCKPWMNSLIIKVLGLSVPKHVLIDRVRRMWKPKQMLKVVPLSNEYYIVSFSSKEDRDYAFYEGPWMIDDHYILVQRWRPNFNPRKADNQKKVAVWIRIPDLPLEFCTVESLGMIGNMIKIDRSTSIYDKGEFARICVEIDLQKPLLPAFTVFGEHKQLVYEGLHRVCFRCGLYGHAMESCGLSVPKMNEEGRDHGCNQKQCADGPIGKEAKKVSIDSSSHGVQDQVGPETRKDSNQMGSAEGVPEGQIAQQNPTVSPATTLNQNGFSHSDHLGPQMVLSRDWRRGS
ncbi:hypothetical protein K1719_044528 [Acacia pycnantha]|nr:hypothetical protein K1719_044528 [Acacia pycnantha]